MGLLRRAIEYIEARDEEEKRKNIIAEITSAPLAIEYLAEDPNIPPEGLGLSLLI